MAWQNKCSVPINHRGSEDRHFPQKVKALATPVKQRFEGSGSGDMGYCTPQLTVLPRMTLGMKRLVEYFASLLLIIDTSFTSKRDLRPQGNFDLTLAFQTAFV